MERYTEDEMAERFADMRIRGKSIFAIANAYGWDPKRVEQVLNKKFKHAVGKNIKRLSRLELAKLDALERAPMNAALNEEGIHDSRAIKSCLAIMRHRADLLGLKAPAKLSMTDGSGNLMQNVLFYLPENGRDTGD